MEKIAKKHHDRLDEIKQNVEDSREYDRKNNERYNRFRSFIFKTTLSREDRDVLSAADKPAVEVNVLETYLSRLWGEFSKQIPELSIRAQNDQVQPIQVDVIEGHIRSIFSGSEYENKANAIYKDTMSGGFSTWKVYTEYENENSMRQVIRISKSFDPTLVGFDPLAREPSKHDGQFCYELIPKCKDELEADYPELDLSQLKPSAIAPNGEFRWKYTQENKDIFYICDYYEKKYSHVTLYEISDPTNPNATHTVTKSEYDMILQNWESISEPPQVLNEDRRKRTKIVRYRFIEDKLVERPEDIDYDYFPLIFVDGNSAVIDGKQLTRPYAYNAIDAQRIKNLAASNMVNDLENTRQTDVLIAKESWPEEAAFSEGWLNPQQSKAALVYNAIGNNGEPLPKPDIFPRSQVNPAFMQVYDMQDKTIQTILGSYDAQLGIQQNQLSGVAIVEGATQSNNAAMPYVINYLASINQLANVVMNLLPKYYKTARTIPVLTQNGKHEYVNINDNSAQQPVQFDFDKNDLEVCVKAGANFDVQRNKAFTTMLELMKVSETFRAMMETELLPLLIDNIDIRGKDQIKRKAEQFIQEQKQKHAQAENKPKPQEQMMQAQLKIENQKLQLQSQKQQNELKIQLEKLQQSQIKLQQSQMKLLSDIDKDRDIALIRLQEAQNEADRTQAQIAIDIYDHQSRVLQTAMKTEF